MLLQNIARLDTHMNVTMSDGNNHDGYFLTHTFPFSQFKREDGSIIYLNVEQITAVYIPN